MGEVDGCWSGGKLLCGVWIFTASFPSWADGESEGFWRLGLGSISVERVCIVISFVLYVEISTGNDVSTYLSSVKCHLSFLQQMNPLAQRCGEVPSRDYRHCYSPNYVHH